MSRVDRLKTVFLDDMPETLDDGVLYVSPDCHVALHNCACGCGEEVSTPLVDTEYALTMHEGQASVWPSIGNHDFACASHYIIKRGNIVWAGRMSRHAIEAGRADDRRLKRPPAPTPVAVPTAQPAVTGGYIRTAAAWIREIWRRLFG